LNGHVIGALLLLLPVLGASPAVLADTPSFILVSSTWGTASAPIQAGPGDQNVPLMVSLQYLGTETVVSAVAILSLPEGITNTAGSAVAMTRTTNVLPYSVFPLLFNLNLASTTALGNRSFALSVEYFTASGGQSNALKSSLTFSKALSGRATLAFASPSPMLIPGQTNNVSVALTNVGTGAAFQISFKAAATAPASVSILNSFYVVPSLSAQSTTSQTMSVFVPASAQGSAVSLDFTASYKDPYGNPQSTIQTVGYYVLTPGSRASPISVSINPSTLAMGIENNVTLFLANTGSYKIENVSLVFDFPAGQLSWLSSSMAQVKELLPGQNSSVAARIYVPPGATASSTLRVSAKYYDTSGFATNEIRNIGILSRGIIDVRTIDFATAPLQPAPGQIFSLTVTLSNVGTGTAYAVIATPTLPTGFTAFGPSSVFIGDLQGSLPSTFSASILVSNDTGVGTYKIPVQLSYFDNLRSSKSLTINLTVQVAFPAASTAAATPCTTSTASSAGPPEPVGANLVLPLTSLVTLPLGRTSPLQASGAPCSFTDIITQSVPLQILILVVAVGVVLGAGLFLRYRSRHK
jgi:uncharacterized repeat protein (TIGR01451 family)